MYCVVLQASYVVTCIDECVESKMLVGLTIWIIWWTTLLWQAIRSPFVYGFIHVNSRCSHVSISLFGQSVQFGFGYVSGQKVFFNGCPRVVHIRISMFV